MDAGRHPDESRRLSALRRFSVLDTDSERAFDDIVQLASKLCEVPVSLISLVDEDRQWFKAKVGLEIDQTPREQAICAHAILQDGIFEIPDTQTDTRSADNPLCIGEDGLRFYAGATLKSADGMPIGTLCVLDYQPRELTDLQREALEVLAKQVMTQLELRETIAREAILRKEIDHRVKNSLQSVSSFVSLERKAAGDEKAQQVLASVQQQIETVALLHQQIGTGDGGDDIALDDYLGRVVALIARSAPRGVSLRSSFAPVSVSSKQAAAVAMIVNELAANAIKHSFGDTSGTIAFSGEVQADGSYRLSCQDNGTGKTESEPSRRSGLGLSIIRAAVAQLGGVTETESSDAGYRTTIIVRF